MDEQKLEKIASEIGNEWQMGGLFDGIYREFFLELIARYEAEEKEESK